MTVFVHQDEFVEKEQKVLAQLHRAVKPDLIELESDLALIAVVGRGMRNSSGIAGAIFSALAKAKVNIKMIDHLIIAGDSIYSFRESGILDDFN